jgi:hypothetical protein
MKGASVSVPVPPPAEPPPVSWFEFWPAWLFYAPVAAYVLAQALRHGSLTLPTAANPTIESGGLCGESKSAILGLADAQAQRWIVPWTVFTAGTDDPLAAMARAGLAFPVVAKPDIGCNGAGVRRIGDAAALAAYVAEYPAGERVMLQSLATEPGEAGVFYIRPPDAPRGRITSLTLKEPQQVTGDGRSTLRELILADARAGRVADMYLSHLGRRLAEVPARGETVPLVFVGNHCKGSVFHDGAGEITRALEEQIERIARGFPGLHFGRFDVRYTSLADLRRGEGFRIIELNGVGSEATHIWDRTTRLRDAYAAQFFHWRSAYEIGAANRRLGHRPTGIAELFRLWRLQKRLMASYPAYD